MVSEHRLNYLSSLDCFLILTINTLTRLRLGGLALLRSMVGAHRMDSLSFS